MAHGPSRSAACGIFPDQGSNPCPLHWQADSQPLRHQGSPRGGFLLKEDSLTQMGSDDLQQLDDSQASVHLSAASSCEANVTIPQLSEHEERALLNDSSEMTVHEELVLSVGAAQKTPPLP